MCVFNTPSGSRTQSCNLAYDDKQQHQQINKKITLVKNNGECLSQMNPKLLSKKLIDRIPKHIQENDRCIESMVRLHDEKRNAFD